MRILLGKQNKEDSLQPWNYLYCQFDWANDNHRGASVMRIETYYHLARLRYTGHGVLHGEVDEGMRKPGRPKKGFREGLRNGRKT